jgi:hypothetical protein
MPKQKRPAARLRDRPAFYTGKRPAPFTLKRYGLLGHSHPFAQSSQQPQSQLQSGQSWQQSAEQQALSLLTGAPACLDEPTKAAAIRPDATARPPSNFTNIVNLTFWLKWMDPPRSAA